MLSLTLFGSLSASLRYSNEIIPLTFAPRVAELLAFLALGRGRFYLRSEIADSVWNATESDVTLGCVNTALWRLRHAIEQPPAKPGDFVAINRQGAIGLNGPGPVCSDVSRFEELTRASSSTPLDQVTEVHRAELCAAIELHRASALADFQSDWALRERERLRNGYLNALGRLMHLSALKHDYDSAIHYARLVLEADSLREDVHRELMRYLVLDGQRASALRQFEICRAALKRELAIHPMKETMAVYHQIAGSAIAVLHPVSPGAGMNERRSSTAPRRRGDSSRAMTNAVDQVNVVRNLLAEADQRLAEVLEGGKNEVETPG